MTWEAGSAAGVAEKREAEAGAAAPGAWTANLSAWAFFSLAAVFAVQSALATGFFDTDYFWHLETGRWILAEGRLPDGDIFSHSFAGAPWALHEWLAQVLLFLAYDLGGGQVLLLFVAALCGGALFFVYSIAARILGSPLVAAAFTLFFSAGLLNYVSPRPQVFSYLLFALWLTLIWRARYEGRCRLLLWLPPIMLLWVNLHGGYVIGLSVALAYLVLDGANRFLVEEKCPDARYLRYLGIAVLLSSIAVVLNPDGVERYLYPFEVMSMSANSLIAEWGSFDFHKLDNKWVLVSFLAYLFLATLVPRRLGLSELLVPLITLGAALTSVRHAPYATLVMTAYGALMLSQMPRFQRWREAERGKAAESSSLLSKLRWAAAPLLLAGLLIMPFNPRYWERMEAIEPRAMMSLIRAEAVSGPLYNAYGIGGYLVHALGPERPVLIDGRADMFGDAFVEEVAGATRKGAEWRESLERWDAQYLVIYSDSVLASLLLLDPGFGLVCEEAGFALFVRRAGPNGGLALPEETESLGDGSLHAC